MGLRVVALTSAMWIVAVSTSEAQTLIVNGQAAPAGVTVAAAMAVSVEVEGGPGNPTDWIALYPSGAPHSGYLSWAYLNGSTSPPAAGMGAATLSAYAPVTAGVYEWRLFSSNSYTLVAASGPMTVTASSAVLTVNGVAPPGSAPVVAGGAVAVSLSEGPANATDWIALAAAGAPNTSYVDWRYLNGTTVAPTTGSASGGASFLAPTTPGTYEIRLFAHSTFERVMTSAAITVSASAAALTVNGVAPPTAVPAGAGTYVSVGVSDGPGQPGDWVGLYAANAADNGFLAWKYLNGSATAPMTGTSSATLSFAVPVTAGSYEFRFFKPTPSRA